MRKMNMVLLVALFVFALPMVLAENHDDTNETVNMTLDVNAVPYFVTGPEIEDDDPAPVDEVDLYPNTTTTVWCNGTVNDTNGYADLASASGVLFHQSSSAAAADDPFTHYSDADCDASLGVDGSFACSFQVEYYATNGTWTCEVNVTDSAGQSNQSTDTSVFTELLAIGVDNSDINFGSLAMGENTTTTDYTKDVFNQGNIQIDLELDTWSDYATPDINDVNTMNCSTGALDASYLRYSLAASTAYSSKTSLTGNGGALQDTAFDLSPGSSSSRSVHFGIGVPNSGLGGTCSGVLSFSGIANS